MIKILIFLLLMSGCSQPKMSLEDLSLNQIKDTYFINDVLKFEDIKVVDENDQSYDFIVEPNDHYVVDQNVQIVFNELAEEVNLLIKVPEIDDENYLTVKPIKVIASTHADTDANELILVNKQHQLAPDFIPKDLVESDNGTQLNLIANNALQAMKQEMQTQGLSIEGISGYRSYDYQEELYHSYATQHGVEEADTFSARAGFSEHQTGLAMDIAKAGESYLDFGDTAEYQFVKEHAHEYGFIIRYTEENREITGYINEPWHIRYVGNGVATEIYENNIDSFETYLEKK